MMANAILRAWRLKGTLLVGAVLLALGVFGGGPRTVVAQKGDKKGDTKGIKVPERPPQIFNDIMVSKGGVDQVAFLNEQLQKGWTANKLEPSDRCTDYEFLRRASLDIIGRIAKVSEIQQFMNDPPRERRSRLIERLLESDEFPNHFANLWTHLLLTRSANKRPHDQMHLWLYEEFEKKDSSWKAMVTELLTASGPTNDEIEKGEVKTKGRPAAHYILAHLGEQIPGNARDNGRFEMVPVTSRTTRLFLGLRTQCTQCHDHPFNDEWRQAHFWGINAFFRQVDAPNGRPVVADNRKQADMARLRLVDNPNFNVEGIVPYERRNGLIQYNKAVFLDGRRPSLKGNRREELARLVTTSPYFAKAFVNRMWGHFLGRGFTKDVDDFGQHSEVSHPELLDKLAKDWAEKYRYDPRALIRWICNSRAYHLNSIANSTNDKPDAEPFFSRILLRALTPEQLFESLMVATEAKIGQNRENRQAVREKWLRRLIVTFGDDEGNEGTFSGTVVQALLMMNGQEINNAIADKDIGTVATILKKPKVTPRTAMHDLYMAALNRPPTDAEYTRILNARMMDLPRIRRPSDAAGLRNYYHAFYQDLFWALLNSNEFILNH
ncbi:MAG: DUF1549 and DUF1553 domain-containing protein [Gemmataceae bacterium]|nr:DUF1549 and DUF1553 domain-containing protein [Gemmataceae bacterium]